MGDTAHVDTNIVGLLSLPLLQELDCGLVSFSPLLQPPTLDPPLPLHRIRHLSLGLGGTYLHHKHMRLLATGLPSLVSFSLDSAYFEGGSESTAREWRHFRHTALSRKTGAGEESATDRYESKSRRQWSPLLLFLGSLACRRVLQSLTLRNCAIKPYVLSHKLPFPALLQLGISQAGQKDNVLSLVSAALAHTYPSLTSLSSPVCSHGVVSNLMQLPD